MSSFSALIPPTVESLTVRVIPPNIVELDGTITVQEPSRVIGAFLKTLHAAALADGLAIVKLDVTKLKFVNSSAIRLFLDWAGWLKGAAGPSYKLHIITTRKFTWQKTSFVAITALASGHVEIVNSD